MFKASLAILVTLLLAVVASRAETAEGTDTTYYTKLRFDFAARKDFSPGWELEDARKAVIDSLKKGDYDQTKTLGDAWLAKVPVDAEIYLVIALSRKEQGDLAGYCSYMSHFYGLLSSITSSGDGRSAQTAFKVIAIAEEYYLLREIGAKLKKQSLVGHCDVMIVDQNGKEMTYYFDASIPLEFERKELGLK